MQLSWKYHNTNMKSLETLLLVCFRFGNLKSSQFPQSMQEFFSLSQCIPIALLQQPKNKKQTATSGWVSWDITPVPYLFFLFDLL